MTLNHIGQHLDGFIKTAIEDGPLELICPLSLHLNTLAQQSNLQPFHV